MQHTISSLGSRRQLRRTAAGVAAATVALLHSGIAGSVEITPTPTPPQQLLLDAVAESVATNTGTGVSAVDNGDPFTWVGETAGVLGPEQGIRYRLYSYQFSEEVDPCGSYRLATTMTVESDGPDIGANDNIFFGVFDSDEGVSVSTAPSPAAIGQSSTLEASIDTTPEGLAGGVVILYGATTFQAPDISSGYTFGPPEVELVEDRSACPPDEPTDPVVVVDPPTGPTTTAVPMQSSNTRPGAPLSFTG